MKNKLKINNGITLIALVITIIVLLILAGVSIATLTGDNGILSKAQSAKIQNVKATAKEKVDLALAASLDETGKINLEQLKTNLNNINGLKDTLTDISFPLEVTVDGAIVTIKKDSNGEYITEVETADTGNPADVTVTAQQIAANPKEYYGKKVNNYKTGDDDTNTYRIFYVSKTANEFGDEAYTIYLKADFGDNYNLNNYASYDSANTKVRKMNPLWAAQRTTESSWNNNEKAAAYLCSPVNESNYSNSELPWKSYYKPNDKNVNYVIGGPSIEMYVKSYNQTHDQDGNGNSALECHYQSYNVPGYGCKYYGNSYNSEWSTNVDTLDYSNTYNSMYCGKVVDGIGSKGKYYWWLASPSAYDTTHVCYIYSYLAELNASLYSDANGFSPLISLKPSFKPQI